MVRRPPHGPRHNLRPTAAPMARRSWPDNAARGCVCGAARRQASATPAPGRQSWAIARPNGPAASDSHRRSAPAIAPECHWEYRSRCFRQIQDVDGSVGGVVAAMRLEGVGNRCLSATLPSAAASSTGRGMRSSPTTTVRVAETVVTDPAACAPPAERPSMGSSVAYPLRGSRRYRRAAYRDCCLPAAKVWQEQGRSGGRGSGRTGVGAVSAQASTQRTEESTMGLPVRSEARQNRPSRSVAVLRHSAKLPTAVLAESVTPAEWSSPVGLTAEMGAAVLGLAANLAAPVTLLGRAFVRLVAKHPSARSSAPAPSGAAGNKDRPAAGYRARARGRNRRPEKGIANGRLALAAGCRQSHQN